MSAGSRSRRHGVFVRAVAIGMAATITLLGVIRVLALLGVRIW